MASGEGLTGEMQQMFDRKLQDILKAMGLEEGRDDVVQQCGALRIRIYEAGEYKNKETLEMVKFEKGIDLKQGSVSLHVEASDIAQLIYQVRHNSKVHDELEKRLEEERIVMRELGFV